MKSSHKIQLLDVTPNVMFDLVCLPKIEIKNADKLPFGEARFFESVQLFDGAPLKFIVKDGKTFFCDTAFEQGGAVEVPYLTELVADEFNGKSDCEYLLTEIEKRDIRKKKWQKKSDAIARANLAVAEKILNDTAREEYNTRLDDMKIFTRAGLAGYKTARLQALSYICEKSGFESERLALANQKIEDVARTITEMHNEEIRARAPVTERTVDKMVLDKNKPRIRADESLVKFYTANVELRVESPLELMNDGVQIPKQEPEEKAENEKSRNKSRENETTIRQKRIHKLQLEHSNKLQKGEEKNATKSNSQGLER